MILMCSEGMVHSGKEWSKGYQELKELKGADVEEGTQVSWKPLIQVGFTGQPWTFTTCFYFSIQKAFTRNLV